MRDEYLKRLTIALYRVTDRLAEREPLRWVLRDTAIELERKTLLKVDELSLSEQDERARQMKRLYRELVRALELAASLSYVYKINFDVLIREYLQFGESMFPKESSVFIEKESTATDVSEPSERQKQILELLSGGTALSVGDITKRLETRVSDKTLQRDLTELINSGRVSASGERRWRKYSKIKS
jgi:hypothetical protein